MANEGRIIIAGGGPVGLIIGLVLGRAGNDVTVLDKGDIVHQEPRAATIHPASLDILGDLGCEFGDLTQWPDAPDVEEDGATFEENAKKKASELAKALGHWVLAEDSGLVVPAAPGVFTIPPDGQHNAVLVFVDPPDGKAKIAAPATASDSIGYLTAPVPRGQPAFRLTTAGRP